MWDIIVAISFLAKTVDDNVVAVSSNFVVVNFELAYL